MSQHFIQQYLNELSDLRKASGSTREGVVSEAFKGLLKGYAKSHDLIFIPQYELPKQDGKLRWVDGALLYDLRVPFGYWEAKDEEDDLDKEIAAKFRRGYRLGNRSALEWILDQHKEKTLKDPTIREKFNTYRFADHKEKVIDLLMRVTRVSVETMEIVEAMKKEKR